MRGGIWRGFGARDASERTGNREDNLGGREESFAVGVSLRVMSYCPQMTLT